MKIGWTLLAVPVAWAALIGVGYGLMRVGVYGIVLFAFLPLLMGAFIEWSRPAASLRAAVVQGALTAVVGCLFFVVVGVEGLICTAMSLPIAVPLGIAGSCFVFTRRNQPFGSSTALLLLPLGLGSATYDVVVSPRTYEVTTSIEIAASPETVWRHVISYTEMTEPTEWIFRTGLGYPRRVRLAGEGVGALRYCDFSTGTFVEPITIWEPGKRLEFDVTESAAPMLEWGPYGDIHPTHLHGYFVSKKGRFLLTQLANGHTRLDGTSWYQHGLQPGQYWRWWSAAIIHRIHKRVLSHVKELSES